jgi:carbon monoxide dehydrogenase subunit G
MIDRGRASRWSGRPNGARKSICIMIMIVNQGNMFSYKGSDGNLQAAGKTTFEPKDNGTQVTMDAQIKGVGFLRLLEGLVVRQSKGQDGRNFDALKLLLEAS